MINKYFWPVRAWLNGFWSGESSWGYARLLFVLLVVACGAVIGSMFGEFKAFSGRFLITALLGVTAALAVGVRYIKDIYNLPSWRPALRYLIAALFGLGYPTLTVSVQSQATRENKDNLINIIGGPGRVRILPGNAVLFERLGGPAGVRGVGTHLIPRFETIKEVVSLDDQETFIDSVTATTKDGIEVTVRGIRYRYRIYSGAYTDLYDGRTMDNPYPHSVQAVKNVVYNRSVRADGLIPWDQVVRIAVDGVITDYIQQHQVDHLTAPQHDDKDPRAEIKAQFASKGFRDRLRGNGAQLLWVDIGHFDLPEKGVKDQRVNTWGANWSGNARVSRAYGEAQRIAFQELGRAEAQAEILMSIIHSLDDIGPDGESTQHLQNIILARTAQILEAMTERYQAEAKDSSPQKPKL